MTLPWQAWSTIALYSRQTDVTSLLLACPGLAPCLKPRLYRSIIIDVGKRSLGAALAPGTTIVRTTRGLRQLLRVLAESPNLGKFVRRLEVRSNIPISDCVLKQLFSAAFTNLSSLESLYWSACPELPIPILALLPNPSILEVLVADFAIRPGQYYEPIDLSSLRVLKVQPFLDSNSLAWLASAVEKAPLQVLSLSKDLDKKEVGSSYAFVGAQQTPLVALDAFFTGSRDWQLRELKLHGVANTSDCATLADLDLSSLEHLSLSGQDLHGGLLASLVNRLGALQSLVLDWDSAMGVTCQFLESLSASSLELTVHSDAKTVLNSVASLPLKHLEIKGNCTHDALPPLTNLALESLAIPFDLSQTWQIAKRIKSLRSLSLRPSRSLCGEMSWQWLLGELEGIKVDIV